MRPRTLLTKMQLLFSLLLLTNTTSAIGLQQQILVSEKPGSNALIKLHKALVEHESISGNEQNVTRWLVSYLKTQNFTVETQDVTTATSSTEARQNILAFVGKERRTRTLITSHLDVVPPYWPYETRGNQIWGRGSVDAKGCVAAQIMAVEELVAADKIGEGDVAMLFVVGEEVSGDGMVKANELALKWARHILILIATFSMRAPQLESCLSSQQIEKGHRS
jgi:acetylornithine deacetylase